jgi:hypothetical protein
MGTRRGTAAQSAPQGGQPVAAAQPSRRGDHIPADTTAWDLLMGRRYTRTAKPAAPSQPTKQPANPQSSGGSKRVAWKLPAAATANAAVAVASALAILPTARAEFAGPVLDPSILLQDEGAVWAQIFAALLIWVVFRLGRYLAGASRRAMRFLNINHFPDFDCLGPANAGPQGPSRRPVAVNDCCRVGSANFLVCRSGWGTIRSGLVQDGTGSVSQGTPLMTAEGLRGGVRADHG